MACCTTQQPRQARALLARRLARGAHPLVCRGTDRRLAAQLMNGSLHIPNTQLRDRWGEGHMGCMGAPACRRMRRPMHSCGSRQGSRKHAARRQPPYRRTNSARERKSGWAILRTVTSAQLLASCRRAPLMGSRTSRPHVLGAPAATMSVAPEMGDCSNSSCPVDAPCRSVTSPKFLV